MLLLGGCSTTKRALSALTGNGAPSAAMPATAPAVTETGTVVGQQTMAIRAELQRLDDNITRHRTAFAAVRGRLGKDRSAYGMAAGALAAPGATANPALTTRYGAVEADLDGIDDEVGVLDVLAHEGREDRRMAAHLRGEIGAAAGMPGGNDKDLEQIGRLRQATANDLAAIDGMNRAVAAAEAREKGYVAAQRRRLASLGVATPERRPAAATVSARVAPTPPTRPHQPLVTIRFDRRNVPFEHALYLAVASALDRNPDLRFDVIAVSPGAGNARQVARNASQTRHNAGAVMRALVAMGLPANRITISATTNSAIRTGEVRIYVK
ncbi:MAG: hypothetical protein ACREFD_10900 [Stellaceae bacterium]